MARLHSSQQVVSLHSRGLLGEGEGGEEEKTKYSFIFFRPILSAHYLELQSTGNITADGEGFETDQTTGCFGGSSIHHGGGASASVPQE